MVAIKSSQAHAFLKSPDPSIDFFLIYGPDTGLVSERSLDLAAYLKKKDEAAGEVVVMDDSDLSSAPEKLAVELQTVPMFGGRKIVRLRAGQRLATSLLEELVEQGISAGYLIVEAGDLKKNSKLRHIFERSKTSVALPCYQDDIKNIALLIDEELQQSKLRIDPGARTHLIQLLGTDRGLSRAELKKLILYMNGRDSVTIEDIDAVVGDSSLLGFDSVSFSATAGNAEKALQQLDRMLSSGQTASGVITALGGHLMRLYAVRSAVDEGGRLDMALKNLRPPLHFKREREFSALCRRWTAQRLIKAMGMTQEATRRCRTMPQLERVVAERLLISIGKMAPR